MQVADPAASSAVASIRSATADSAPRAPPTRLLRRPVPLPLQASSWRPSPVSARARSPDERHPGRVDDAPAQLVEPVDGIQGPLPVAFAQQHVDLRPAQQQVTIRARHCTVGTVQCRPGRDEIAPVEQ